MGDADAARQAKHLGEIAQHLKQLVKITETLNDNFVKATRSFMQLVEMASDDETPVDPQQMTIGDTTMPVVQHSGLQPGQWGIVPSEEILEDEAVHTPSEWMDKIGSRWSYKPIGNTEEIKLTMKEFVDYLVRVNATPIPASDGKESQETKNADG